MKGCLSAIGAIVICVVALPFGCSLLESYGRSDMAAPDISTPPINATPDEILSAFRANEVSAKDRFGAAPVKMTGRVDQVSLNLTGGAIISMRTEQGGEVQAHMLDSAKAWTSRLSPGSGIAVLCNDPYYIMGVPTLSHCTPAAVPEGAFDGPSKIKAPRKHG